MKKIVSLVVTVVLCFNISVPAFAVDHTISSTTSHEEIMPQNINIIPENGLSVLPRSGGPTPLSETRPDVPDGFSYWYSRTDSTILNVIFAVGENYAHAQITAALAPIAPVVGTIYGLAVVALQALNANRIPGDYVEYIYECDNPETEYQVPYVYWHLYEITIETDTGDIVLYTSYYEWAVMPRSL